MSSELNSVLVLADEVDVLQAQGISSLSNFTTAGLDSVNFTALREAAQAALVNKNLTEVSKRLRSQSALDAPY